MLKSIALRSVINRSLCLPEFLALGVFLEGASGEDAWSLRRHQPHERSLHPLLDGVTHTSFAIPPATKKTQPTHSTQKKNPQNQTNKFRQRFQQQYKNQQKKPLSHELEIRTPKQNQTRQFLNKPAKKKTKHNHLRIYKEPYIHTYA
jgi:hypothetical protein